MQDTIRRWRQIGRGPPWIRLTSQTVRYRFSDVGTWLSEQRETKGKAAMDAHEAAEARHVALEERQADERAEARAPRGWVTGATDEDDP